MIFDELNKKSQYNLKYVLNESTDMVYSDSI